MNVQRTFHENETWSSFSDDKTLISCYLAFEMKALKSHLPPDERKTIEANWKIDKRRREKIESGKLKRTKSVLTAQQIVGNTSNIKHEGFARNVRDCVCVCTRTGHSIR